MSASGEAEDAGDHAGDALPVLGFGGELFASRAGDGIKARAAIVAGHAPGRHDPAALHQARERGVYGALVELQDVSADLFDAAGDAVAVQRTHGVKGLEYHEIERALQDFGFGAGHEPLLLPAHRRMAQDMWGVNR